MKYHAVPSEEYVTVDEMENNSTYLAIILYNRLLTISRKSLLAFKKNENKKK